MADSDPISRLIEKVADRVADILVAIGRVIWKIIAPLVKALNSFFKFFTPPDDQQSSDQETVLHYTTVNRGVEQAAETFADGLIAVIKFFLRQLQQIPPRLSRFFSFFLYLNWKTVREVILYTTRQRLPGLSAEMAYHSTLALFPALLALLCAVSSFDNLQAELYEMARIVAGVIPAQIEQILRDVLNQFRSTRSTQVLSFSFVTSVWLFSGAIGSAMSALNHIHQVPRRALRPFWKKRLVSIGLAVGSLFLLILASVVVFVSDLFVEFLASKSCILETMGNCPIEQVAECMSQPPVQNCLLQSQLLDSWQRFGWPIALSIIAVNFALLYRYGPSRRRPGTPLLPGAMLAAVAWAAISYLFKLYVFHFGRYSWTYGAIGAFIVLLLWLYISCLIMLIGAQLNVTVGRARRKHEQLQALTQELANQ
ncbi:MAG: YihY/virulence factor BrkB family protein [Microcoleaceae cyanobacterium]